MTLAELTDAALSALVAEKVAGWKQNNESWFAPEGGLWSKFRRVGVLVRYNERIPDDQIIPDYATDANAVLGLLEKGHHDVTVHFVQTADLWCVTLQDRFIGGREVEGKADSLCRSACYALLRAHGWKEGA